MKLYTVPFAPNPTKVALYLAERDVAGHPIDLEQEIVDLRKGEQRSPQHLDRNPFGTLPVLELDDGFCLVESLTIINFFEAQFPEGALLPQDVMSRAKAQDLERIVECRLGFTLFEFVHAVNSPLGHAPDRNKADAALTQLAIPLDFLESALSDGRAFLTGEAISIADISLASYLNFASLARRDILGDRIRLKEWHGNYISRVAAKRIFEPKKG